MEVLALFLNFPRIEVSPGWMLQGGRKKEFD